MAITTRTSGAVTVMKLERRWTADEFGDTLRTLLENGQVQIVVNCLDLPLVDSAGTGEFVQASKLAKAHGGAIKIMLPKGMWGGLLGKTKLMVLFETYDTEAEAIASFGGGKG